MNSNHILFLTLIVFLSPFRAQSQHVEGVVQRHNGVPLANTTVFIDGTTSGDITDHDGRFSIRTRGPGAHLVIASHVGYRTTERVVTVRAGETFQMQPLVLVQELIDLDEIVVVAPHPGRWRRIRTLTQDLLGRTTVARKARLMNPEVLSFTSVRNGFAAEASSPLIVENPATGYRIHVFLHRYVHNQRTGGYRFASRLFFESMGEVTQKQFKLRDRLFKGSMRHFLWAWYHDRTRKEGFFIDGGLQSPRYEGSVAHAARSEPFVVTYKARPDGAYRTYASRHGVAPPFSKSRQVSRIAFADGQMAVAENGFPLGVVRQEGYWAYRGIGDVVPPPGTQSTSTSMASSSGEPQISR